MRINADYSTTANPYAWNKQVDSFWVDQPVYVFFCTLTLLTLLTPFFSEVPVTRPWKMMVLAKVCNMNENFQHLLTLCSCR